MTSLSKRVLMTLMVIMMIGAGCFYKKTASTRSDLSDPESIEELTVMTKQNATYRLHKFVLKDSSILGDGFYLYEGKKTPFHGEIRFEDISYVQMTKLSLLRGIVMTVPIVIIGSAALQRLKKDDGFSVTEVLRKHYPSSGGGGSCPFVYSWDGQQYVMEGEAISTGWGRAFETETRHVLPSLSSENDQLRINITNERPETYYINSVELLCVESSAGSGVAADPDGNFWPITEPISPIRSKDRAGFDIRSKISKADHVSWFFHSSNAPYHDSIELVFEKPPQGTEATLLFRSINTELFSAVLQTLSNYYDGQMLDFAKALETDPEMIALMNAWLNESSLKASLWKDGQWKIIGTIPPEANAVPFTRALRFDASGVTDDTIRIRLTGLSEGWKLDAVQIDWNSATPLPFLRIDHSFVMGPCDNDDSMLVSKDDRYSVLLPGDEIQLEFDKPAQKAGKIWSYAVEVRGYIHEWFPKPSKNPYSGLADLFGEDVKTEYLKAILRDRSVFLPLVLAEWENMRKN